VGFGNSLDDLCSVEGMFIYDPIERVNFFSEYCMFCLILYAKDMM